VNAALSLSGGKRRVADADVSVCALRTGRICEILRVLVQQFAVLETMSAQGFNDFRDFLTPASGFQSAQFRTMENKLGMRPEQRVQHSGCPYYRHLAREAERVEVLEAERETGLLALAGAWLETLLDDCCGGFDFAAYMADAVEQAAVHDRAAIEQYPSVRRGPAACPATAARSRVEQKAAALEELEQKRRAHLKLFDKAAHDELIAKGARHLSFKATMACVFVESFALELSLQTAHRLVSNLVEIDELIARWRHRHSGMVLRMIGTKSGTGGSSGHAYLNAVQHKSRIFVDLCHCAHYLLPQHAMPPLPPAVRARLARRLDHADLVDSPFMSPPPPRTKWTRRVPHPVLIGHAASLSQVAQRLRRRPRRARQRPAPPRQVLHVKGTRGRGRGARAQGPGPRAAGGGGGGGDGGGGGRGAGPRCGS